MKSPRDIVLVGTGFLLGIIFCYFLTASRLVEPKTENTTDLLSPAAQTNSLVAAREVNRLPKRTDGVRIEEPTITFEWHSRYVPVRRGNNMFRSDAPGGSVPPTVPQYDLIDFKYVPDFKLPEN